MWQRHAWKICGNWSGIARGRHLLSGLHPEPERSRFVDFGSVLPLAGWFEMSTGMMNDAELVRSYAETGSEDAFTEVVRRHLPLSVDPGS